MQTVTVANTHWHLTNATPETWALLGMEISVISCEHHYEGVVFTGWRISCQGIFDPEGKIYPTREAAMRGSLSFARNIAAANVETTRQAYEDAVAVLENLEQKATDARDGWKPLDLPKRSAKNPHQKAELGPKPRF